MHNLPLPSFLEVFEPAKVLDIIDFIKEEGKPINKKVVVLSVHKTSGGLPVDASIRYTSFRRFTQNGIIEGFEAGDFKCVEVFTGRDRRTVGYARAAK